MEDSCVRVSQVVGCCEGDSPPDIQRSVGAEDNAGRVQEEQIGISIAQGINGAE